MLENMTSSLSGAMRALVEVSVQVVERLLTMQPKTRAPSSVKKIARMLPNPGATPNRTARFRAVTGTAGEIVVTPVLRFEAELTPDVAKYWVNEMREE